MNNFNVKYSFGRKIVCENNLVIVAIILILLYSCKENPPVQTDGDTQLIITALWETTQEDSTIIYLPLANAEMILASEYGKRTEFTDENGILEIKDIPSSVYQISARGKHPIDPNILIVGNIINVELTTGIVSDTIIAKAISANGISINEIYSAGPVNSFNFFYDQYIELYNSSDETRYLDGMQVIRMSGTDGRTKDSGSDWDDDGDIDGVSSAFKFPGHPGEQNYIFEPHTFLIIAQDAYDHTQTVGVSIDLSNADWEFVNQLNAVDIDNPHVPNLSNICLDKTTDFSISLTSDVVVITSGVDTVWEDGIDFETILDGVEYKSKGSERITLDERIDRGWVQSSPRYSGESMQRREKGVDTNNGTLDWEVIPAPTPGWQ